MQAKSKKKMHTYHHQRSRRYCRRLKLTRVKEEKTCDILMNLKTFKELKKFKK